MLDLFRKVHSYGMCNKLNLKKKTWANYVLVFNKGELL